MFLSLVRKMGCEKCLLRWIITCYKRVESLHWRLEGNQFEENLPKIPHSLFGKFWCSLYLLYWSEKRYAIDHEDIRSENRYGYDLIGNPDQPGGNSTDWDFFFNYDDCLTKFYQPTRMVIFRWRLSPKCVLAINQWHY